MKKILPLFFLAAFSTPLFAMTLSCTHPELCRLGKIIFQERNLGTHSFQTLVKISGDPHDYEPSAAEIKSLMKADFLLAGPHELNPWIDKVSAQRSKKTAAKTITLSLTKAERALYPKIGSEVLSHFWLYPKIFCSLKDRLESELIKMQVLPILPPQKGCLEKEALALTALQETLGRMTLPLVLTHDALLPLLKSLAPKTAPPIVAIKGSGFHEEASPQSVKQLYDVLKAPKVVWIQEVDIDVPANILAKKRAADLTVSLNTSESEGLHYFSILDSLNEKLKALPK